MAENTVKDRAIDDVDIDISSLRWKDELVGVDALSIDATYQRHVVQRLVDIIAANYNPLLAGKIVVSHRNGDDFIVDGQQRWHGARDAGIKKMAAIGITGLSQVEEARLFLALNQGRVAVRAIDNFRAAYVSGENYALDINAAVEERGGRIWGIHQPTRDNDIQAVEALRWVYRRGGTKGLEETLDVVVMAFGELNASTAPGLMLKGIFAVISLHRDEVDRDRLSRQIAKKGTVQLAGLAHGMGQILGAAAGSRSYYLALLQAYNERLGSRAIESATTMNQISKVWKSEAE